MRKLFMPLFLIMLVPLIPFSDAIVDLSNKQLLSENGAIVLEFGEKTEVGFIKTKTTPNFEFGIIQLVDQTILLDASDPVSVRVLGDSIAVKSFDPVVIIYARNTGSNNYSVNVYTIDGGFKKQTFTATLESITSELQTEQTEEINEDIVIAVSNIIRTEVKDTYTLTIRVYDQTINPRADIQKQEGYLEGIEVNIEILDPLGNVFKKISGETDNKGYFIFKHKIIENIDKLGKYTFTITANNQVYEGSTNFIGVKDDGGRILEP